MKFFQNKQTGFTPLEGKVKKSSLTGFTLIELLVVIGIIAILSSILYANFNEARMIARDKARMTSLKEVQLALELYKAQYGVYPSAGVGTCANAGDKFVGPGLGNGDFVGCAGINKSRYIDGLVPEFIGALPMDPTFEDQENRGYYYRSNGTSYKFMSYDTVEVNTVSSPGHEFARCPATSGACSGGVPATTYAVYSAGAEDW
ncbi:MAG TPA: type II secretion system protein [Candidatus Paceibacterota bacterium]|nr:type II secretion system protein [Candidatus Paceibacterota bacterium]